MMSTRFGKIEFETCSSASREDRNLTAAVEKSAFATVLSVLFEL